MPKTIFLPKWTELLIALYNSPPEQCYCGRLHKATGTTIRHIRNLIADLENMGIVRKVGNGKIRYIELTETGKQLAEQFLCICPQLKR